MNDHNPAPFTYQDRLIAFVDVLGFAIIHNDARIITPLLDTLRALIHSN